MVQEFLIAFNSLPPDVRSILTSAGGTFVAQFLTALGARINRLALGPEFEQRLVHCYQAAVVQLVERKRLENWSEPRLQALAHVFGIPGVVQEIAKIVAGKAAPEETTLGDYFRVGVVRCGEDSAPDEEVLTFIEDVIKRGFLPVLYGLLIQTIRNPDLQVAEIIANLRHENLTATLGSIRDDLLQAIARPSPSTFRKAYGSGISGHMLSRELLDVRDLEQDSAVKPHNVDEIVEALLQGRSVAVQGPPGSGKSALACIFQSKSAGVPEQTGHPNGAK